MPSIGIGAKLRQARLSSGLTIDHIARDTRIPSRYLDAIEAEEFESLPSLVFTRNFVRQFALILKLDPEPLLAGLPTQDQSPVLLPDPPARPRSSYRRDRQIRTALTSAAVFLSIAIAATLAWLYYPHFLQKRVAGTFPLQPAPQPIGPQPTQARPTSLPQTSLPPTSLLQTGAQQAKAAAPHPVQVVIRALQPAWVQMSADGRTAFTGMLQADEIKEIAADEQVKLVAGNAGALTISLNGKTLEPLGPLGQVRVVRLTAEGPQFLSRSRQPAPDPL